MSKLNLWKTLSVAGLFCALAVTGSPAGAFNTLLSFNGRNGANPVEGLVQGRDGDFYGTTFNGGANDVGKMFKVSSAGKLTTLYNFCSLSGCGDGQYPLVGLVLGTDGNFYGTTSEGGKNGSGNTGGTVFKITPAALPPHSTTFALNRTAMMADSPVQGWCRLTAATSMAQQRLAGDPALAPSSKSRQAASSLRCTAFAL